VEDVLYVSNKAITTEGTKSYVTLQKEDGTTQKTMVTTGFSDGHNVEIKSGLEEGDTVLIESQVSQ
jgi:HlyD family secretion protein